MGRPPSNGAPAFRFNPSEVAQMEAVLQEHDGQIPAREILVALAEKFSNSTERAGKVTVQMKQVWNWFQNRRYALRSKLVKSPGIGKLNVSPMPREEVAPMRNVPPAPPQIPAPSGHNVVRSSSDTQMEFEAKSARDGAWYDVQAFLSHRYLETGNPEVLVRFAGFGPEEDEWVNVRKHVRQRSLPCESSECVAVLPGDLILCFQEGKEQALYFDAHVLDAQRRRHDIRGCRCRFLVRYDHDQSEEIVPLRKVCRRPETDYRLQQLHAADEAAAASASASTSVSLDPQKRVLDPSSSTALRATDPNPSSSPVVAPLPNLSAAGPVALPTASALVPAPAPIPTPVPIPVPAPTASLAPASARVQALAPGPTVAPAPAPALAPAPVPAATVLVAAPVTVSVPETNKAEGNNQSVLSIGAAAPENIVDPGAASTAPEVKNAGSIDLETAAVAGSNPSTAQVTSKPTTAAAGPEKSEGSNSGHPESAGSTAPVSAAPLPAEDMKE